MIGLTLIALQAMLDLIIQLLPLLRPQQTLQLLGSKRLAELLKLGHLVDLYPDLGLAVLLWVPIRDPGMSGYQLLQ